MLVGTRACGIPSILCLVPCCNIPGQLLVTSRNGACPRIGRRATRLMLSEAAFSAAIAQALADSRKCSSSHGGCACDQVRPLLARKYRSPLLSPGRLHKNLMEAPGGSTYKTHYNMKRSQKTRKNAADMQWNLNIICK